MFAGRARELDRLTNGLRSAQAGRTTAFALVGEPGIGKTRLASELSHRAQASGFGVCWGRAWEAGGAPALWPWRQVLEAAGVSAPLSAFDAPGAAREFSATDPEVARFAQFRDVVSALKVAAAKGPLLCVLDDLHAADLPSIELATFVLRNLRLERLCLLCTWRDREASQPPLRAAIGRLAREAEPIALERLSADESAALVQDAMGDRGADVAAPLYRATAGNPLFLVETLRSLAQEHGLLSLAQLPVSHGITAVVHQRTERLDERHRALLGVASAIGREGELELWAAAADLQLPALEPALGPLFSTGLLSRSTPTAFSFSHALVRDAVYSELPTATRNALHEKLAAVLDARVRASERRWIEPRAHHALLAAALDPAEVTGWVLEAASQLRSRAAWEAAVALLDRALAAVAAPAPVRAELLLARGWALGDAGESAAMRECFGTVARQAREQKDPVLFARAVQGLGSHYVFGDTQTQLVALIDEALAGLSDSHPAQHARLTARKAAALTPAAVGETPLELARAAVREVRSTDDAQAQLDVAVAAGSAMGDFEVADARIPVNTDMVRLARAAKDPVLELRGLSRLVTDYVEVGDLPRADACMLERSALVRTLQLPRLDWSTPLFTSMRAMGAGDFAACDAAVAEVRRRIEESDDAGVRRIVAMHAFWLALLRDDTAALEAALPEALRSTSLVVSFPGMLSAAAHAQRGDAEAARRELLNIDAALPGLHTSMSLTTCAPVALLTGALPHARTAYALLKPRAHVNAVWGLFALTYMPPVSMTLGMLAAELDDAATARAYFEAAHARAAATRAQAHAAWVAYHHGRALLGPLKDPGEGRRQLDSARQRAAALGMTGLEKRAERALEGVPAAAPPATAAVGDEVIIEAQGADWLVRRGPRQVLIPSMKGMPMLAELVAHPNREVHALELVGEAEGVADAGDSGELLDEDAKSAYRTRLRQLTDTLEDARELGNVERAEAAQEEIEALQRELSRAVGLGGRDRRGQANAERARIAARRRLRDAIARITQADVELGQHLDRSVRTGTYCSYAPQRRAGE